jgi:hypothetical protein
MGLLASGHPDGRGVRMPAPVVCFPRRFRTPTWGPRRPECHQHREEGERAADAQPAQEEETPRRGIKKRRRRRNTRSILKHPDVTLATYV